MNIQASIEKDGNIDVLVVKIPVSKSPSSSGKTTIIASTNGNQVTQIVVDGKPVIVGLNAYIK